MATTFKAIVIAHQKKKDGTYNIKIRIIHNRKIKYLPTAWYVEKKDLNKAMEIKNTKYLDLTYDLIRKYRGKCDAAGEALKTMTIDQIVEMLTEKKSDEFYLDIVDYTRKQIEIMRATGHSGNARTYEIAINSMVRFAQRDSIPISEVTAKFLREWIDWMNAQPTITKGFAAHNYLNRMRAIHNKAKKEFNDEDAGIIRIPNSPFLHIDFPKQPTTRKRALSAEQMRAIANLEYTQGIAHNLSRFNLARDIFLLSFCLVGMNAVDMFDCTDYRDGRLTYQRSKTKNRRKDHAEISIRIEPEVQPLFDKYRDTTGKRVFNFYKMYSNVGTFSTAVNAGLKKIGKLIGADDLEFYAARHTWATIAVNDVQVDKFTVHTALNHVDETMKVTDIYIRKSWTPIDNANRKVLDYLNLNLGKVEEPKW